MTDQLMTTRQLAEHFGLSWGATRTWASLGFITQVGSDRYRKVYSLAEATAYVERISTPAPIRHGERAGYFRGCRCPECVAANTADQMVRRRKRAADVRAGRRQPPSHGASGYFNWGCHCDVCKAAGRQSNARTWARRKAARS